MGRQDTGGGNSGGIRGDDADSGGNDAGNGGNDARKTQDAAMGEGSLGQE